MNIYLLKYIGYYLKQQNSNIIRFKDGYGNGSGVGWSGGFGDGTGYGGGNREKQ